MEGEFELLPFKGEEFYEMDGESFWVWWERATSYIASSDTVDFCFISNKSIEFYQKNFSKVPETTWTLEEIKKFLKEQFSNTKIKLKYTNGSSQEEINFPTVPEFFSNMESQELLITTIPAPIRDFTKKIRQKNNKEEKENPLRDYYVEQLHNLKFYK